MWKEFLYFTRKQRMGVVVLLLICLVLTALLYLPSIIDYNSSTPSNNDSIVAKFENFNLSQKKIESKTSIQIKLFNPNLNSLEQLVNAGIPKYLAQNIVNYRSKGGVFKTPSDLRRLYTMTDSVYNLIEPYTEITATNTKQESKQIKPYPTLLTKPVEYLKQEKYEAGLIVLELNRVDTLELKKIPGIGSFIANSIVRYRDKLGGFYKLEQLDEININSNLLKEWLSVDTTLIRRLKVNNSSFKELLSHPYLNYEQTKAIENHKRKYKSLKSIKLLELLEEFNSSDFERLKTYLNFE